MFGQTQSKTYLKIFSDGSLRIKVPEGTEGAVRRDYELKDGTKGTVYELVFSWVEGYIRSVKFVEGQFGTQAMIDIDGTNGDKCCLAVGVDGKFAGQILEKLPNINPEDTVRIQPFSYTNSNDKQVSGVTITQNGEKIESAFKVWNDSTKSFDYLLGFPKPEETSKMNKDKWKLYFTTARIWLREYLEKNTLDKFNNATPQVAPLEGAEEDGSIDLSSIPF